MSDDAPLMYRLHDAELLRKIMLRTGTGARVTCAQLSDQADVPSGTIGSLLSGAQRAVAAPKAFRIADVLGVDHLVIWVPQERAGSRRARPADSAIEPAAAGEAAT